MSRFCFDQDIILIVFYIKKNIHFAITVFKVQNPNKYFLDQLNMLLLLLANSILT